MGGTRRGWGGGGQLFEFEYQGEGGGVGVGTYSRQLSGCSLNFSAFRMSAYSRWALIQGWVLIQKNAVISSFRQIKHDIFELSFN